eukprot:3734885-Prymnesium_polylepis.1
MYQLRRGWDMAHAHENERHPRHPAELVEHCRVIAAHSSWSRSDLQHPSRPPVRPPSRIRAVRTSRAS